jgi:hypothetical protein
MTVRTKTTSRTHVAYELRWSGGRSRRQAGHLTDDEFTEVNRFLGRNGQHDALYLYLTKGSENRAEINLRAAPNGRIAPADGLAP